MYSTRFTGGEALRCRSGFVVAALAAILLTATVFSEDNIANADVRTAHPSLVSETASFFTPGALDGRVDAVAIEGDTVYVGGTFTQIQMALDGEIFDQAYLFAYSKSTGAVITDFDPVLNAPVRALQTTGEGTGIFVGGEFTVVNGETNRKGLVKLDDFGDRVQSFSARPDKRVYTMDRSGNTLYIGGNFENVSTVPVENLAALDTETGALLPNIDLDFDGAFSTSIVNGFQSVQNIEVTSDNQIMVVVGNFKTINGISRSRLAVIELGDQALVSDWNTDVFDVQCPRLKSPQYINGIDIAPDDSYFVTGTTGAALIGNPACDTILRFEFGDLTDTDAQPTWIDYTGGDSVYEVAVSEHAIYTGGHFRWLNNGYARDRVGPGAVERAGLAALDPLNGLPLLNWQSDRNPRGVGVFALEVQPEGLYIGDDTDFLNGFYQPKFKFLPLTSNTIARPDIPSLPTTIFNVDGSTLDAIPFDGTTLGSPMAVSSSVWRYSRGAMFLGGQLFHADDDGDMWVSPLRDDDTFGPATQVDLFGLTSSTWDLARLGGMFFDHEKGRVYYTLTNDSRLFWRAFTPDGPLFGDIGYVAEEQADILWYDVRGMDVIDGYLYFGRRNGYLYRAEINGSSPVSGTTEVISGPVIDSRDWDSPLLAFSSEGTVLPPPSQAQFEFESAGSSTFKSFQKFEFPVEPGQPVNVRLSWDDPNAQLNVFLRDANDQLVDSDNSPTGSPKWLSAPAGNGGTYTVSVKIQDGSTAYTVSVNPVEAPPEESTDFYASGSATSQSFRTFEFPVASGEPVNVRLTWDDPGAQLNVFLRDASNELIDFDNSQSGSPKWLSAPAGDGGTYTVAVKIQEGSTAYTVSINPTEQPPEPLADFVFSASGDENAGRWKVFNFDVVAGDLVEATVLWDDPATEIRVFLRDETNTQVDRDIDDSGSPAVVSTTAETSGTWSVGVSVGSGAFAYDVLVNTSNGTSP